jgi:hypothetical protein
MQWGYIVLLILFIGWALYGGCIIIYVHTKDPTIFESCCSCIKKNSHRHTELELELEV